MLPRLFEFDGIELLWEGAGSTAGGGIGVEGAAERPSAVLARVFAVVCVAESAAAETSEAMSASALPVFEAVEGVGSLFTGNISAVEATEKLSGREAGELKIFSLNFFVNAILATVTFTHRGLRIVVFYFGQIRQFTAITSKKLTRTDCSHTFPLSPLAGAESITSSKELDSTGPSSVSSERPSVFGEEPLVVEGLALFLARRVIDCDRRFFITLSRVSGTSEELSSVLSFLDFVWFLCHE